jgi:septal ring factor EnvC (AmiA/AmiB activator)
MDVQTILLSVEERDKWRHRLEVLRSSLAEVKLERSRVERQLRHLKRELGRLTAGPTEASPGGG